jgi:predicted hydrolase (HD superfamily)
MFIENEGGMNMQRDDALQLLQENLRNENLINHSLAVEAIMRGLAVRLQKIADQLGL